MGGHLTCAAITDKEHHLYTVHTTVDGERLIAQFRSAQSAAQAVVRGPDSQQICFLISGPTDCVAPVAGAYTIDVYLYYGTGTDSYAIGVDSRDHPAHCTQIDPDFFAVTAKPLGGSLPAGSAGDCYRFAGRAGDVLRIRLSAAADVDGGGPVDVRGVIESAGRENSCDLYYSPECTLVGDGPYTFFLTEQNASAASYRLRMTRLDQPTGCASLTEGAFGALTAAQVDQGNLDHDGFRCLAVAVSAGRHLVRFEHDASASWTLRDGAGKALCSDFDPVAWAGCVVPAAGDYLLWMENGNDFDQPIAYQVAVINLAGTAGCANAVGTAWDQPTIRLPHVSPLQVFCQPFTAQPGERVVGYGPGSSWISDASGDRICDGLAGSDDEDGCVLPGSGPYRLLSSPGSSNDGGTLQLQLGRLSSPVGCPTAAPGAYGAAPTSPLGTNRCRVLTIPAAGTYRVRAVDREGYSQWSRIYDRDGKRVCTTDSACAFPAAGSYALVANGGNFGWDGQFAVSLLAAAAPGCVAATDQGAGAAPVHGKFAAAGQIDCLRLPTAAGSLIGVLQPARSGGAARPDRTLVDATGQSICDDYALDNGWCQLTGQAPFRLLLGASEGTPTGDYLIAVQRSGPATGCAALPQGTIGSVTGTTVAFSPAKFTACFAIPAGQHSTAELVSYQALTGASWARMYVFDNAGDVTCTTSQFIGPGRFLPCHFTAGKGYTAVVVADSVTSKYRVSRKDASPAGAKCQAPASTTLGGKASAGTLAARDDLRCYRITGTAATLFWVSVRSNGALAHYLITDASGADEACGNTAAPCRLTGSTKYQVIVWGDTDKHSVPYQLDTWNIGTPGQTPAQCKPVPSAAGFGPLTATLAGDKTGVCLAVPVRNFDRFTVALTNTAGGSTEPWQPMPYLIVPEGATGLLSGCALAEGGYLCEVTMPIAQQSGVALFVVSPGQTLGKTFPFRAKATCDGRCDAAPYSLTSVVPASVPNGGKVTVTLHGKSLFPVDSVLVSRAGAASIRAAARTISVDRQTMTVQVDLTTAPAGTWTVAASAYSGGSRVGVLTGALTVTASVLRATKAPSISGSARVGHTVRVVPGSWTPSATGYAYQWLANGVAIRGAVGSAYVIPASLLGKRLSVTVTAKRSGFGDGHAASVAVTVVR